jgi:hypothetical protein
MYVVDGRSSGDGKLENEFTISRKAVSGIEDCELCRESTNGKIVCVIKNVCAGSYYVCSNIVFAPHEVTSGRRFVKKPETSVR